MGSPHPKAPLLIGGVRLNLVVLAIVFALPFKWIYGPADQPGLVLGTWLLESCLMAWFLVLSAGLDRIGWLKRLRVGAIVFYLLFEFFFATHFSHDFFFVEAADRKFTLLDCSPGTVYFFFTQVVPPRGWLLFGAVLVVLHALAVFGRRLIAGVRLRTVLLPLSVLSLAIGIYAGSVSSFPSPFVDFVGDLAEIARSPAVRESPAPVDPALLAAQNRAVSPEDAARLDRSRYKKILVFVMESITQKWLAEDSAQKGPEFFFVGQRAHARQVPDYFASDQDSRTGLLALLGGRLIPFEAYTEEGLDKYFPLRTKRSLVDLMNEGGYRTAFAASETESELVVWDLPWQERINLSREEFDRAMAERRYACLNPYEFEHSCEDRILLPRLFDLIDRSDRLFLFNEFIFGHAGEYHDLTGVNTVTYYSNYLNEIVRHLDEKNLLEETLIVITSDHGIRDRGYEGRLSAYHLPLWFVHPSYKGEKLPGLYSQVDFKDLLLSELAGDPPPADHDLVLFAGCTNTSLLGAVTRELDLLVIKDRAFASYVLSHGNYRLNEEQPMLPPASPLDPGAVLKLYHAAQRAFVAPGFP